MSTVIILVILAGLKPLEEAYRARVQGATLELEVEPATIEPLKLHKAIGVRGSQVKRAIAVASGTPDAIRWCVTLVRVSARDLDRISEKLRRTPGIIDIVLKRHGWKVARAEPDRPTR